MAAEAPLAPSGDGGATPPKAVTTPRSTRVRSGLVTSGLLAGATLWYVLLLVAPLAIVVLFSFGRADQDRRLRRRLHVRQLRDRAGRNSSPFTTSLFMSIGGTVLCLLVGLPLAYYIATRAGKRKGLLIILLVIPFWTSFLIRTYAWLMILGPDGPGRVHRRPDRAIRASGSSARRSRCMLGLVYGYLPLMVFPIYVTLERMDRTLVEASKDLGAGRWATFRQITLPIILPGLITGSILVFIPMMGEYVIPQILGLRAGLPDRQRARQRVPDRPRLAGRRGQGRRR